MKVNVGTLDRALRIAIGFAALVFLEFATGPVKWWGLLGLVPLLTGLMGNCPLYSLLGVRTDRASPG